MPPQEMAVKIVSQYYKLVKKEKIAKQCALNDVNNTLNFPHIANDNSEDGEMARGYLIRVKTEIELL